jgi:hypothetical protein
MRTAITDSFDASAQKLKENGDDRERHCGIWAVVGAADGDWSYGSVVFPKVKFAEESPHVAVVTAESFPS